jgi:hypothetical protein
MSTMSELIEEDVIGECTKASVAVLESSRPPDLAIQSLVYSKSSKTQEIARWI